MKSKRLHNRMVLLRPDGRTESYRIPKFWTAEDVAAKLRHSEVFQYVSPGEFVMGYVSPEDIVYASVGGPAWVMWDRERDAFVKVVAPDERNALEIVKARRKHK